MKSSLVQTYLLLALFGLGCSSPQPSGGSAQEDGGPAKIGGNDERCLGEAYASDECDLCVNTHCCNERFTCYDEKDCYWADYVYDKCTDGSAKDAGDDAWSADSGGDPKTCWEEFEKNGGEKGKVLYSCIQESCKDKCNTP